MPSIAQSLEQLQQEGRLSNQELADRVGLTPAPCLRRVRRLEAEGIITGYTATAIARADSRITMKLIKVQR